MLADWPPRRLGLAAVDRLEEKFLDRRCAKYWVPANMQGLAFLINEDKGARIKDELARPGRRAEAAIAIVFGLMTAVSAVESIPARSTDTGCDLELRNHFNPVYANTHALTFVQNSKMSEYWKSIVRSLYPLLSPSLSSLTRLSSQNTGASTAKPLSKTPSSKKPVMMPVPNIREISSVSYATSTAAMSGKSETNNEPRMK